MVEFGEQLRRAREGKGMTQQSLAEQLYVTRQSVSRWECGDRYPDLLTTKKISQILDVSLDDLLAGKDMVKLVERNPVIEKKSANYIMIALYAFIVFSFLITIIDMIIRFPLQSQAVGYSDIQLIVINILGIIIQIVFFTYGLYQAVKGTLSPKRMGVVIVAYFGAMCITGSENIIRYATWQLVCVGIALIIPSIIGAIASFCYFIRCKNDKIWSRLISVAAIWGIIRIVINNYQMIRYAEQYLSMNTTVRLVLQMAIYGLILYQTFMLTKKRKNAIEISNTENIENIEINNVQKIGSWFLENNKCLKTFIAPNVTIIGEHFLYKNTDLEIFDCPSLKILGSNSLYYVFGLKEFNAPNLNDYCVDNLNSCTKNIISDEPKKLIK